MDNLKNIINKILKRDISNVFINKLNKNDYDFLIIDWVLFKSLNHLIKMVSDT